MMHAQFEEFLFTEAEASRVIQVSKHPQYINPTKLASNTFAWFDDTCAVVRLT